MGRREEKREQTRQDIVKAAAHLFASVGYDETSVDDIASKADIAKGTFYYHFPTKVAVVKAIQRDSLAQTAHKSERMIKDGISAKLVLRELLKERAAWMESNKELARVIVMERFANLSADHKTQTPPFRQILSKVVKAGQQSRELKSDIDCEELAIFLAALMVQGVSSSIREEWRNSLVERVDLWLDSALKGIEA